MFAAALALFWLISSFWHTTTLPQVSERFQLSAFGFKLIYMITRKNRFHGYGSLKYVYRHGQTVRGPLFAVRFVENPKRKTYRLAVVVSRKVHKSAVGRNRMRRRLYAIVRAMEGQISVPADIVITVFSDNVIEEPADRLASQVKKQLKAAGLLKTAHPPTADKQ
jgi:ribonuclease P protein component